MANTDSTINKWVTVSEYVDEETGEILHKNQVKEHYIIIKKIKHHETYKTTGKRTITNICKKTNQQKLFT